MGRTIMLCSSLLPLCLIMIGTASGFHIGQKVEAWRFSNLGSQKANTWYSAEVIKIKRDGPRSYFVTIRFDYGGKTWTELRRPSQDHDDMRAPVGGSCRKCSATGQVPATGWFAWGTDDCPDCNGSGGYVNYRGYP